jgi:hypothetical protein
MHLREVIQLGVKVIGILGLCEENRFYLPTMGVCDIIIQSMRMHETSDGDVLSNALWSLVILCRPMGSIEGNRYDMHESTLDHISGILGSSRAVDAVMGVARRHQDPRVLAKAFWAIVNLSLNNSCKAEIINRGGLEIIVLAMKRYDYHLELQHRALFALVNLSIRTHAKLYLREVHGLHCIIQALTRFLEYQPLVRCAAVLINTLSWDDPHNRTLFRSLGAMHILKRLLSSKQLLESVRSEVVRARETLQLVDRFQ